MKYTVYFFCIVLLGSCTSNTIFKKPENLIPKDTITLLLKDMFIAKSAKNERNLYRKRDVNYMPFIYNKYKIDSTRFKSSYKYYVSKIDDYNAILKDVKEKIQEINRKKLKKSKDSISKLEKSLS